MTLSSGAILALTDEPSNQVTFVVGVRTDRHLRVWG
jgi:hypothetical protein